MRQGTLQSGYHGIMLKTARWPGPPDALQVFWSVRTEGITRVTGAVVGDRVQMRHEKMRGWVSRW